MFTRQLGRPGKVFFFFSAVTHGPHALFHGGNKLTCVANVSLLGVKLECAMVEIYRHKHSGDFTAGCLAM